MTHLMPWQAAPQRTGSVRRWTIVLLRMLGRAIDGLVIQLDEPQAQASGANVEYATVELGGRLVGAYYLNGELVGIIPDAARL